MPSRLYLSGHQSGASGLVLAYSGPMPRFEGTHSWRFTWTPAPTSGWTQWKWEYRTGGPSGTIRYSYTTTHLNPGTVNTLSWDTNFTPGFGTEDWDTILISNGNYFGGATDFDWWTELEGDFTTDVLQEEPCADLVTSTSTTKALSLWNGSSNDAPPTDWYQAAFDDSAWVTPSAELGPIVPADAPGQLLAGAYGLWSSAGALSTTEQALFRVRLDVPDVDAVHSATLAGWANDDLIEAYVNGTRLTQLEETDGTAGPSRAIDVRSLIVPDAENLLAFRARNQAGTGAASAMLAARLTVECDSITEPPAAAVQRAQVIWLT